MSYFTSSDEIGPQREETFTNWVTDSNKIPIPEADTGFFEWGVAWVVAGMDISYLDIL